MKHVLPNYRIAIVGSGAIGCYYGGKLAQFGRDVHFLARADLEVMRKRGIRIRGKGENIHIPKVQAHARPEEIGPCDLVIVALKVTANAALPALIAPLLGEKTMILTLQNGLGSEEFLAEHFGAERILGGLCFICLNRRAPGVIENYDQGNLVVGEFGRYPQPRTHDVAWEFKRCGVVSSVVANLARERWRKLVWNISFNGLAIAAGGIDTAAILADDGLRRLCVDLMDETIAIANRCGCVLPTAVALEQMKRAERMGQFKPSTLMDYLAGRPLEIEAIWGEPLRRGQVAGVETPRLEMLYRLLVALDGVRRR